MITRAEIATLHRALASEYRPYFDLADADWAKWAELQPATIMAWFARAEAIAMAERSWRRSSGYTGCIYSAAKGCPPWALSSCVACQDAATHQEPSAA